jgi:hypothetical protein
VSEACKRLALYFATRGHGVFLKRSTGGSPTVADGFLRWPARGRRVASRRRAHIFRELHQPGRREQFTWASQAACAQCTACVELHVLHAMLFCLLWHVCMRSYDALLLLLCRVDFSLTMMVGLHVPMLFEWCDAQDLPPASAENKRVAQGLHKTRGGCQRGVAICFLTCIACCMRGRGNTQDSPEGRSDGMRARGERLCVRRVPSGSPQQQRVCWSTSS